jgi:hypothetical protein
MGGEMATTTTPAGVRYWARIAELAVLEHKRWPGLKTLAKGAGVAERTLAHYYHAGGDPRLPAFQTGRRLAESLGMPMDELVGYYRDVDSEESDTPGQKAS